MEFFIKQLIGMLTFLERTLLLIFWLLILYMGTVAECKTLPAGHGCIIYFVTTDTHNNYNIMNILR